MRRDVRRSARREPAEPRRLRLDLSFVGAPFRGWQAQAKGPTVQDALESALRAIQVGASRPVGCSRTDAGVHARRFVAHVDVTGRRTCEQVLKGLDHALSEALRVHRVAVVPGDFHARYACLRKRYRYFLHLGPVAPPALAPYLWSWQGPLDLDRMAHAARLFEGEHDFARFTTAEGREKNTLRSLDLCRAERRGPLLVLTVAGRSFLHRMVRCVAGALVAVGSGRLEEGDVARALAGERKGPHLHALPAQGLHLWDLEYPETDAQEAYGRWPEPPAWVLEE